MGKRVSAAIQARKPHIEQGDTYLGYIDGKIRLGVDADKSEFTKGWQSTAVPLHGKLFQSLFPAVAARYPKFGYRMAENADELAEERAKVATRLLDYCWRECDLQQQMRFVVGEAMPFGLAIAEIGIDAERDVPTFTWHQTRRVLFDAECREEPSMKHHRWIGIELFMPLATATERFGGHKFTPVTDRDEDEEEQTWDDEIVEQSVQARVLKVYMRGDNPHTKDANLKAKTKVGKKVKAGDVPPDAAQDEAVYDGNNRIVWFEYSGDGNLKFLKEEPWPYVLDHDEFPIEVLKLTLDTQKFYPYSIFSPVHSLQVQANWGQTRVNTTMHRASQTKVLVSKSAVSQPELDKLLSPTEYEIVMTEAEAAYVKQAVQNMDFLNPAAITSLREQAVIAAGAYEQFSGLEDISMQAKSHQTATTSALQDKKAEIRIGFYADQVERFVSRCAKKMVQIAYSTLTAEDIEAVLGPLPQIEEVEVDVPMVAEDGAPQLDEEGNQIIDVQVVRSTSVWPTKMPPEVIRREVDLIVEPRSMRYINSEQNINELKLVSDAQINVLSSAMAAAQQSPEAAALIVKSGMEMVRQMAAALQLPEASKFLIGYDEALATFQSMGATQEHMQQMEEMGQAIQDLGAKVQEHDAELEEQTQAQIMQLEQGPMAG